jgi:glutathione S-transferase
MAPATLAYWDIRGLAQPIRLLLEYTGTEFEDKFFSCGPAPKFDKSCWFDNKFSLGLDFPNLPYFVDGDIKITQSNAILRYIARKNDLLGKTEEEKVRVDMMAEQSMDFRNGIVRLCYNPNFDQLKADYLGKLPTTLKMFSDFLGKGDWFAGANITFVDFVMYELLDQHRILEPDCLKSYPNLSALLDRFEKLPKIEAYMKSSRFMKNPINNKMAKFGFE